MSQALKCGHCGAPLPAEAARVEATCAYCGTTSSPAPRVVERVVERVLVVPATGAPVPAAVVVHCPRCGNAFTEGRLREHRILGCQTCGGVFLEKPAVALLERHRDEELLQAVLRTLRILMPFRTDRRPALSCPHCQQKLERRDLGESGHAVDICSPHGVFFDRGEVTAFAEFLAERRARAE